MGLEKLEKTLEDGPRFRLAQVKHLVFHDLISDWSQATVLPQALRNKLAETRSLRIEAKTFVAEQGKAVKALIALEDGLKVESVLMRYKDRNTVCVSSMIGCPLACSFCATGQMGFKRNLNHWEIVEQVLFFNRYLKKDRQRVNSLVFMGMGEPFLNYEPALSAIKVFNDKDYFNIGSRHISISTVGVLEGIEKLAQEPLQINLAVSLHAPNDRLRTKIMPVNRSYPLAKLWAAIAQYLTQTRRKVMFEYIMIRGANDGLAEAQELAKVLSRFNPKLFMVNLIAYNPTGIFQASQPEQIRRFKEFLVRAGIEVTERYRFGRGINAGCGQLAAKSGVAASRLYAAGRQI